VVRTAIELSEPKPAGEVLATSHKAKA
jgi:hypothetical protein